MTPMQNLNVALDKFNNLLGLVVRSTFCPNGGYKSNLNHILIYLVNTLTQILNS